VSFGVLGSRERLPEPSLGTGREHQALVCHLKEFGSYLGVATEALLKLQEGEVQGAKELGVGEGTLEVGHGFFVWVVWFLRHLEPSYLRESNEAR
jgi:hypothetical protein